MPPQGIPSSGRDVDAKNPHHLAGNGNRDEEHAGSPPPYTEAPIIPAGPPAYPTNAYPASAAARPVRGARRSVELEDLDLSDSSVGVGSLLMTASFGGNTPFEGDFWRKVGSRLGYNKTWRGRSALSWYCLFVICMACVFGLFGCLAPVLFGRDNQIDGQEIQIDGQEIQIDGQEIEIDGQEIEILMTDAFGPVQRLTKRFRLAQRSFAISQSQLSSENDAEEATVIAAPSGYNAIVSEDSFTNFLPASAPSYNTESYNTEKFVTRTVITNTDNLTTTTGNSSPTLVTNCCPTYTSYYPNRFHCPSPTLQPHLSLPCPTQSLTDLATNSFKTITQTSTLTLPCSAQAKCPHLPNGDFCIPETTYIPNPVACPTSCPPLPTGSVVITHVVLAEEHGENACVLDAATGEMRDVTDEERYQEAGGMAMYGWDRYVGTPVRAVSRLLGQLGYKGVRKVAGKLGYDMKKKKEEEEEEEKEEEEEEEEEGIFQGNIVETDTL